MPMSHTVPRKVVTEPWKKWWCWHPVKVNNTYTYFETVYRRTVFFYIDMEVIRKYEYTTLFDLLKSNQ
jgi:hypothetical protein